MQDAILLLARSDGNRAIGSRPGRSRHLPGLPSETGGALLHAAHATGTPVYSPADVSLSERTAAGVRQGGGRRPGHPLRRHPEDLRRRGRGRPPRSRDRARRVLHAARAVGLGQDDDAAADRRLRAAGRRPDLARRRGRGAQAAVRARRQHRLPGLRALPTHDRVRERRVRPAGERREARGAKPRRRGGAGDGAARGLRRPQARPALGRPAPARRARARHRQPAEGAAARRAAGRARPEAPARDARFLEGAPARPRYDLRLRDARPGGGADDEHRVAVFNLGRIEQIGTPTAIYERPETEFVADFVGTSNIVERDGRRICLRPERIAFAAEGVPATRRGRRLRRRVHALRRRHRPRRASGRPPSERRIRVEPGTRVNLAWRDEDTFQLPPVDPQEVT